MNKPFILERYFDKYEFSAPYLLSCSDCESMTIKELSNLLLSNSDDKSHHKKENEKLIENFQNLKLSYTESSGNPILRELIIKNFHNSKILKNDNVLIGTPEELIYITMRSILKMNDQIICTFPGYQSLYSIAETIGCKVNKWEMNEKFEFDVNELFSIIDEKKIKMVIMNFPHNPSGYAINENDRDRIVEKLKEKKIILFSDEMYRYLDISAKSLSSCSDCYEKCISLFGTSKSLSLPGLRIGWLTVRNEEIMKCLQEYKDYTTICSSGPSEILAMWGIKAHKKIIQDNIDRIKENIEYSREFYDKHKDIFLSVKYPLIGSIGIIEMKLNKNNIEEQAKDMIDKKGLMLLPCTVFEYTKRNCFRIGYGRKNFKETFDVFKEYILEEYYTDDKK